MLKLTKYDDINLFQWFDNAKYTFIIIIKIIGWMIHENRRLMIKKLTYLHYYKM